MLDDRMTVLYQIFVLSRIEVVSANSTARQITRAVLKRRTELRRLPAIILAFSRIEMISRVATARFDTRAVTNRRFKLWRLPQ